MSEPNPRALLERAATRYLSVQAGFVHRLDPVAMFEGLERFRGNPHIARWLHEARGKRAVPGIRQAAWRVWFSRPAFHREERYADPGFERPERFSGGDGSIAWSWVPRARRASVWRDRSVESLLAAPSADLYPTTRSSPEDGAGVAQWFDPVIGELLEPSELLVAGLSLEVLGRTEFLGRQAIHVQGHLEGWDRDRPTGRQENLPPADDYRFLVDAGTGMLLRVANRFDGKEVGAREVVEVAFDEELPPQLFHPPRSSRRRWRAFLSR